ncbi:MAG: hypothetical protein GY810_22200 [Aureispira sp.]|nr:hypothetical protein [Aureispira sp.]
MNTTQHYNIIYTIFLLLLGTCIYAQPKLMPTEEKAVITFVLHHPTTLEPIVKQSFGISSQSTKETFPLTTNSEGKAAILLPVGDIYNLHFKGWRNYATIEVPALPYQRREVPVPYLPPTNKGYELVDIPAKILLLKSDGSAFNKREKLTITNLSTNKKHFCTTNKSGIGELALSIGASYSVSFKNAPNYCKFSIPKRMYAFWEEKILFERIPGKDIFPMMGKGLLNFHFRDLEGKPQANEVFVAQNIETRETLECTTNKYGIAQLLVPLNARYTLSTSFNDHFQQLEVKLDPGFSIVEHDIHYQSMTTTEWDERQRIQEEISAARDSIAKAQEKELERLLDSIKNAKTEQIEKEIEDIAKNDHPISFKRKTFRIRKEIEAKAEICKRSIKHDPNFLKKNKKPVLSTLFRLKEKWKGKVIVTDITQSMSPYMEEVLIWHALNLRHGEQTFYVFFNDGDSKMASAKKVGSTGGIYTCKGSWGDMPKLIETMQIGMKNGLGGGEPPENDIEAALVGAKEKGTKELVLIVDCYSAVRDMALLDQVNIPIRIVLCGAEDPNNFYAGHKAEINEQYLTIAHRTGGSIHTLKQDIWDLSKKKNGDKIYIDGNTYILRNKQFLRQK